MALAQLMEHVTASPQQQHLFWRGAELVVESRTLGEVGLLPDATVYLRTDAVGRRSERVDAETVFIEGECGPWMDF